VRATFRSFAKVNLHLQVVGRRVDGYHELRTVFQNIDWCDRLGVELTTGGVALEVRGTSGLADGPENLARRAAERFLATFAPRAGARVVLEKRLPLGGGLGGGSSNAAAVLLALRELAGVPARRLDLWPIARELGADVPYFLTGGTALGVGRGDEVVPLPELPPSELVLVLPPFGVSTAEVFAALAADPPPPAPLAGVVLALAGGESPTGLDDPGFTNDLERAARRVSPALAALCDTLANTSAVQWARMTGSGATLIAGIDARAEAEVARGLPAGVLMRRVRTLSRQEVQGAFRCGEGDSGDGDH
jgi:4-diphosphocytidyl-2-C-methyl-D-erythritol kinase